MSTTIRVSESTRDRVAALARRTGRPMTEVLAEAVDALERRVFFEELHAGYARLRQDPTGWREVERERDAEDHALPDRSR